MTAWIPEWKLTIDGINYASKTIANISHFSGRQNIYQQPSASQLSIEIVDLNSVTYNFDINDGVNLSVKDSTGAYVSLFGGYITDVKTVVKKTTTTGAPIISYELICLGALSKLTRTVDDGVLSKDFDGNQIKAALTTTFLNSWNEVSASQTWSTYSTTETWTNAQNVGLGEIDTPGDYELTARSADPTDLYTLVSALATSGLGYIYEDSQGRICYADSTHRSQYLAANGYTEISANKAIGRGLQTLAKTSDVRNQIKLIYKNGAYVTVTDTTSQATYGQLGSVITTSLENGSDATTQANYYLTLRAQPKANISQITFPLSSPELTTTERDKLINIIMGLPVIVKDLPTALGSQFYGFVEGWAITTSYNNLNMTLYLSPLAYSLQAFKWSDVPITETWTTLNTNLTWADATIVS
jgi:hypothetical protein